jgi:hypothetical protein
MFEDLTVQTVCDKCGAALDTPYVLLGATTECQSCGEITLPRVQVGTLYPVTGYEITFADFQQLLSYSAYRPSVTPLLQQWFGYELEEAGSVVRIRTSDGGEIDPLSLHLRIQEDSGKQHTLYRTAMTLWH